VASLDDTLRQVPMFSSLSRRQLRGLKKDFKERTFRPGTAILSEGKMSGVDFFVVVEGEAAVTVGGKETGRLRPGDHSMASWNFRKFVTGNPDVAWKLLQHVAGLVNDDPRASSTLSQRARRR
jgi:hypothetical protein